MVVVLQKKKKSKMSGKLNLSIQKVKTDLTKWKEIHGESENELPRIHAVSGFPEITKIKYLKEKIPV